MTSDSEFVAAVLASNYCDNANTARAIIDGKVPGLLNKLNALTPLEASQVVQPFTDAVITNGPQFVNTVQQRTVQILQGANNCGKGN